MHREDLMTLARSIAEQEVWGEICTDTEQGDRQPAGYYRRRYREVLDALERTVAERDEG